MLFLNIVLSLLCLCNLPVSATEDVKSALKDHVPAGELTKDDTLVLPWVVGLILRNRMTWAEAQTACEKFCSSLVYIERIEDGKKMARVLKDLMKEHGFVPEDYFTAENKYEFGLDRRYWIGLNNLEQEDTGRWEWIGTNIPLNYDLWYSEIPKHYAAGLETEHLTFNYTEHCATLAYPRFRERIPFEFFTFHEEPCSNKHYAICNMPSGRRLHSDKTCTRYYG